MMLPHFLPASVSILAKKGVKVKKFYWAQKPEKVLKIR